MSELSDFLLARYAEDEAVARAASGDPWSIGTERGYPYAQPGDVYAIWTTPQMSGGALIARGYRCGPDISADQSAAHIARHDPARVLAECAAKRQIVGLLDGYTDRDVEYWALHEALELLALPYADHPDYRSEWRP